MDSHLGPTWHQALVFALTGQRRPELGHQQEPDLAAVRAALVGQDLALSVVPDDLMRGLSPARFAAVLRQVRAHVVGATRSGPVLAERAPDADERRLLADVPPHH